MTTAPAALPDTTTPREQHNDARLRATALSQRVWTLKLRSIGVPIERVLLIGGSVLGALGVVFILLGWYGVAHTSYLFEQNAYIVSGGLLGVALVVAGAALYASFWVTKRYRSAAAESQATVGALRMLQEQIQNLTTVTESLAERAAVAPTGAAGTAGTAGPDGRASGLTDRGGATGAGADAETDGGAAGSGADADHLG